MMNRRRRNRYRVKETANRKQANESEQSNNSSLSDTDHQTSTESEIETDKETSKKKKTLKTLAELIHPIQTQYSLYNEFRRFMYFTCFFGCCDNKIHFAMRVIGSLFWSASVIVHFGFDAYAYFKKDSKYSYMFLVSQTIWFSTFVFLTGANIYRSLPRLQNGLIELRKEECYEKTVVKIIQFMRKSPYVLIVLGVISSGLQFLYLHIDKSLTIDENIPQYVKYIFYAVRFISSAHIYSAYILFWLLPLAVIYMTGSSMQEYNAQTGSKFRDKSRLFTFKDVLDSYKVRVKFVNESSSQTGIILSILLVTAVVCFGINAFTFLFRARLYLHVWHSLIPLTVMIAPLCTMAWTTKQYTSFIMVVLRAWLHRDDLDELSSDTDSGVEEEEEKTRQKNSQRRKISAHPMQFYEKAKRKMSTAFMNRNNKNSYQNDIDFKSQPLPTWQNEIVQNLQAEEQPFNLKKYSEENPINPQKPPEENPINLHKNSEEHPINLQKRSEEHPFNFQKHSGEHPFNDQKYSEERPNNITKYRQDHHIKPQNYSNDSKRNVDSLSTQEPRAVIIKHPKFNFEKLLSYLESMKEVTGFQVSSIMITWDKVSTTLFFMFSLIAVFVQESLFGS